MAVQPREHRVRVNGVDLCWFEWGEPQPGVPSILLVHATGFHARCWDRTVAHLGGRHVLAIDMRGHGRSGKQGPITWETLGADLTAFVAEVCDAQGLGPLVGVGHSMGGHCVTQAAGARQASFERLVLVDPVIMAPDTYAQRSAAGGLGRAEDHPTSKRRNQWSSPQEMLARFAGPKSPFSTWDPDVLADYCEYGLLPNPEGEGYVLACPPIVEAAIYQGSTSTSIYEAIARITLPVTVLRAPGREADTPAMDFSKSPTWPGLAARFPIGRDVFLPERTHFIPMEAPALTARYILGEL